MSFLSLSPDGETITLQKFHGQFSRPSYVTEEWLAQNRPLLKRGMGVDVETTGLDFTTQKIIGIAVRPFSYRTDSGEIVDVEEGYSGLQDPHEPISEEVSLITGLTDEMLKGQNIDWALVDKSMDSADLVIAHNAKFDRPFIDRLVPNSREKLWACSFSQIEWKKKGFEIQKLGILAMYHGFFVDAHRAMNDVNAMIKLLSLKDAQTGHAYLFELASNAARESALIFADGSPFESKDLLKANGYKWSTERRSWYRAVYEDQIESEVLWLETQVYLRKFTGAIQKVSPKENFIAVKA